MKLILHTFDLALKYSFKISRRSFDHQKNLIVELRHEGCRGYGEATENPYYQNTSIPILVKKAQQIQPWLEAHDFDTPEALWQQLHPLLEDFPFLLCAIDVAAHDLYGKIKGQTLHQLWGEDRQSSVQSSFTLTIADHATNIQRMQEVNWPLYKIKLGTDHDVAIIEALRKHSDAPFCVDANCAWTVSQTLEYAERFKALNVLFIEQPLPADRREEMQEVYAQSALPIFADESCCTEADVDDCRGSFHGINIKLMKCGGLSPARRMIARARQLGLQVMAGCMTESTVGISATAQLLPALDYADLDGALFLKEDIASGVEVTREKVLFPRVAGTGVQLMKYLALFICFLPTLLFSQDPLTSIIARDSLLSEVCTDLEPYEVKIIYTQIDRDENNHPHFKSYQHQLPSQRYFYPASTVKMPAAFLALEKINQLNIIGLDRESRMITGAARAPQTSTSTDPSSVTLFPSVGHYVKKIFAVSDNEAYNRLYEFLGQEYFNEQLTAKGYRDSRIIHRLGPGGFPFSSEDNRYTNPVSFSDGEQLLYHQGEVFSQAPNQLSLEQQQKGVAYYSKGERVAQPFDFSQKNYVSLENLHDMLQAVLFPEAVAPNRRFDLKEEDYRFLYQCLSIRPRESKFPQYDQPDGYVKFFMYGGEADSIPSPIRIFNKVGWAYGYLTDVAYIIDLEHQVEFMLAATIHVNANQTYNDDHYEYESIGMPFFQRLGQLVYQYEKERLRSRKPDLSRFTFERYE